MLGEVVKVEGSFGEKPFFLFFPVERGVIHGFFVVGVVVVVVDCLVGFFAHHLFSSCCSVDGLHSIRYCCRNLV